MTATVEGWNHNTIYHRMVLNAVRPGYRRALDVGCGEGRLTRELQQTVPEVIGVDTDAASITLARANWAPGNIQYIEADVLAHPFEPESFDLISIVATLHHLDAVSTLKHLDGLLRPGGTLVVIGCARSSLPDLPFEVGSIVANRVRTAKASYWQHPSPTVWPPPESYGSMRQIVASVLPGARFRRRLYWRYSVVWLKPQTRTT